LHGNHDGPRYHGYQQQATKLRQGINESMNKKSMNGRRNIQTNKQTNQSIGKLNRNTQSWIFINRSDNES
jgi:hypothetical protein